ncbi:MULTISPECIES: ABC transporter permease [unclassified Yoonia]|uniref:ABC transporter permease n=1 Tax=unclassified Yoonia TaxID=2629118 RepID=UPI002AFDED3E|nr:MULTISPECIES: ABC transporter permease subunit [unclassified Yoonia]
MFTFGVLYFALPLIGMIEFSLRKRRDAYSFDAYTSVLGDPQFQATFSYSLIMSLVTIILGLALVLPAAIWVRIRLPKMRPVIEFITLLPLVIPVIVIAFGYLRMFNTSSFLPMTGSATGTNILLAFGYATLALPYMYRAIDNGLRTLDVQTLTEAAQILGASWFTIIFRIMLPNVFTALLSGAFLTFSIVLGEYVFAALLDRPAFGPYMVWTGGNRAYEPAALAVIAFTITWGCMGLIQLAGRLFPHTRAKR